MKNRSRRGAERALLTLTTVLLLIGAAGAAWIAVRGAMAYQHLDAARDVLVGVGSSDSDPTVWADDLAAARDDMAAARALTSDPVWAAAGSLPWAGPQLTAIAELAGAADGALAALEPVGAAASALSSGSLRTSDGGYDVELLASWEPAADRATVALTDATSRLSAVELRDVLPALADQVTRAHELFARARADADALHRTTRLLPAMLGADGPRSYLVLFQNSAEWRSLGGVVGAVAQLNTDQGRITLTAQASSTDFRDAGGEPVADVPEGLRPLFDERPARYVQNVTQLPDFAAGAPLAREMWRQQHGTEVDGVIAVDPVALSYLLTATGPVSLPSGDVLTSENTVPLLLDEVYRRYSDPKQQDAFFQSATSAVFGALAAGDLEPRALVEALDRSGRERRLLVWSADSQEQAVLDGSTLQGGLPGSGDGATTLGVYVNDGTGSKMDYYMRLGTATTWCSDGTAMLRVTLRNDAPDPATLPEYVTGGGAYGVPPGHTLTGVYVYLPTGALLQDNTVTGDADPSGFVRAQDRGHEVLKWSVRVAPGQSATLDLTVATPRTPRLETVTTPMLPAVAAANEAPSCADAG